MSTLDAPEFAGEPTGSAVHHPQHYNQHPSGVETIAVIELLPGNLCNALKYAWRCNHKGAELQDLKKCAWYFQRELDRDAGTEVMPSWPWSLGCYRLLERVTDAEEASSLMFVVTSCINSAMQAQLHEREQPQDRARYRRYVQLALSFVTRAIEARTEP